MNVPADAALQRQDHRLRQVADVQRRQQRAPAADQRPRAGVDPLQHRQRPAAVAGPVHGAGTQNRQPHPTADGVQAGGALGGALRPRVRRGRPRAAAVLVQVAAAAAGVGGRHVHDVPGARARRRLHDVDGAGHVVALEVGAGTPVDGARRAVDDGAAAGEGRRQARHVIQRGRRQRRPRPQLPQGSGVARRPHRADQLLPARGERGSARVADETSSPGDRRHDSRP